ncbi:hypothetical protein OBJ67_04265 [Empedobacter falsenii]
MVAIDYYNIVLASFSVIVAVLIGFQIFQVINISEIRKGIKKDREEIAKEKHKMLSALYLEIAKIHYENKTKNDWVVEFEYYSLKSLHHAFEIHDLKLIEDVNILYKGYLTPLQGLSGIQLNKLKDIYKIFTNEQLAMLKGYENLRQLTKWLD